MIDGGLGLQRVWTSLLVIVIGAVAANDSLYILVKAMVAWTPFLLPP